MKVENKEIFANNLSFYMNQKGIDRNTLCADLDLKYTTVRDWLKGITYPRIGKIELLANYFNINKSDLIENKIATAQSSDYLLEEITNVFPYYSLSGGHAKNECYLNMKSFITKRHFNLLNHADAELLGNAILVFYKCALYSSLKDAARQTVRVVKVF